MLVLWTPKLRGGKHSFPNCHLMQSKGFDSFKSDPKGMWAVPCPMQCVQCVGGYTQDLGKYYAECDICYTYDTHIHGDSHILFPRNVSVLINKFNAYVQGSCRSWCFSLFCLQELPAAVWGNLIRCRLCSVIFTVNVHTLVTMERVTGYLLASVSLWWQSEVKMWVDVFWIKNKNVNLNSLQINLNSLSVFQNILFSRSVIWSSPCLMTCRYSVFTV